MSIKLKKLLFYSFLSVASIGIVAGTTVIVLKYKHANGQKILKNDTYKDKKHEQEDPKKINNTSEIELNNNSETNEDNGVLLKAENVFPKVNFEDYYEKITLKDSQAIIDKDMIAFIIQDIIKKLSVNYGTISVGYFQPTPSQLELKFIWKTKNQSILKNYYFKITDTNSLK